MTEWERINRVFDDAEKLRKLEQLYMERGNVTSEEARKWALEKFAETNNPKGGDESPEKVGAQLKK